MNAALGPSWPRRLVAFILLVSLALRLALVLQGGQYYFGDEQRYDRGVQLYLALLAGDFTQAKLLAMLPEHMLFTWTAALLAAGQHALAQFTPHGDWSNPVHATFTIWLGAALLSLCSTVNLFLTHRLARTLGASAEEAAWALLLLATANGAFYYARHLLPYDCALTAALLALVVGLGGASPRRAFACGLLAAVAYGLYNGYWYLVPTVWLTHALAVRGAPHAARRSLLCAAGAVTGLALPVVYGTLAGGSYYWEILRGFGASATQGDFREGWSLPWEYFWHAEGLAGALVLTAIVAALAVARRSGAPLDRRVRLMLIALATAYGLLVLCSVGLRAFVVYARTVKPFLPLLCLLGGWALARLLTSRPRARWAVAAFFVIAGALHFWPHFGRLFPREVEVSVLRHWGNPKHSLALAGAIYTPLALPVSRPDLVLVNAQGLYPAYRYLGYPPGRTLLRVEHPASFLPFQYEGHSPRERAFLRRHDLSIRLIALDRPAEVPDDLPEHLRARPLPPPAPAEKP